MKKGETNLIFDINKISDFVFGDADKRSSEVEITENYVYDSESDKMVPNTRQVKEVKVKDLNKEEMYWINEFNSFERGYNKTIGGIHERRVCVYSTSLNGTCVERILGNGKTPDGTKVSRC